MNELNAWSYTNETAIIEHILARYHQVHRYQLQDLLSLAEKVSSVHADVFPAEILPLLRQTQQELLSHMQKEEAGVVSHDTQWRRHTSQYADSSDAP